MEDILKFTTINKLKNIYRANHVGNRNESSAEHSWSCLILADYLFDKVSLKLDKLKVYELLMYHDVVEIEAGDMPLHPNNDLDKKLKKEFEAVLKLKKQLPKYIGKKFEQLFIEFEEIKTNEAKFAKLIDSLDAVLHEIPYKKDWKGWSKEFLLEKKLKFFEPFPELKDEFLKIVNYLDDEGYFSQ
jgi:putative hydrolases of HD superfamily